MLVRKFTASLLACRFSLQIFDARGLLDGSQSALVSCIGVARPDFGSILQVWPHDGLPDQRLGSGGNLVVGQEPMEIGGLVARATQGVVNVPCPRLALS